MLEERPILGSAVKDPMMVLSDGRGFLLENAETVHVFDFGVYCCRSVVRISARSEKVVFVGARYKHIRVL